MTSRICQLTLDVRDVAVMVDFWSAALGYDVEAGDDGSAKLWPPEGVPAGAPTVWLQAGAPEKREKLRAHLDLTATDGDVDAEVARLLALGATRADVGQTGEEGFEVLADPEGNEFCVLHGPPRRSGS